MRIAIVAALPGELKQIVNAGFKRVPTSSATIKKWVSGTTSGVDRWIAVCAGMGADAARRAFAEAELDGTIDRVISIGWAGALNEDVYAPCSYIATTVVDAQTGERFDLSDGDRRLVLVSTARVADTKEKRRLAASYSGAIVDMESAAIARLAAIRGIPVCCVKAISDEVGDTLPDFNLFIDRQGQMCMTPFLQYICLRPRYWRSLIRLGKLSAAGAHGLAHNVFNILFGAQDFAEINRTGSVDW